MSWLKLLEYALAILNALLPVIREIVTKMPQDHPSAVHALAASDSLHAAAAAVIDAIAAAKTAP